MQFKESYLLCKKIKKMTSPITPDQILYTFKVNFFTAYPTYDNWNNVVFAVAWELNGVYVDGDKIFASRVPSRTNIDTTNITDFVPYKQLTEDMVKEWINTSEGPTIDQVKNKICSNINIQMNPPPPSVVVLPPPW